MTIEKIENSIRRDLPDDASDLIRRCHELRKKDLNSFSIEDLRILIGQQISLDILIPMAIDKLTENILAEGDYYEGDLLKNVLTVEPAFWVAHPDLKQKVVALFKQNASRLDSLNDEGGIKESLIQAFHAFGH